MQWPKVAHLLYFWFVQHAESARLFTPPYALEDGNPLDFADCGGRVDIKPGIHAWAQHIRGTGGRATCLGPAVYMNMVADVWALMHLSDFLVDASQ